MRIKGVKEGTVSKKLFAVVSVPASVNCQPVSAYASLSTVICALIFWLVSAPSPDELHPRALALAAELARGAVVAQELAKRAIDRGLEGPLDAGLALEQDLFAEVFATEDARIGVASFLEHGPGKAAFVGR